MSLELDECKKCGATIVLFTNCPNCARRSEAIIESERRNTRPLSSEQAYHLYNLED